MKDEAFSCNSDPRFSPIPLNRNNSEFQSQERSMLSRIRAFLYNPSKLKFSGIFVIGLYISNFMWTTYWQKKVSNFNKELLKTKTVYEKRLSALELQLEHQKSSNKAANPLFHFMIEGKWYRLRLPTVVLISFRKPKEIENAVNSLASKFPDFIPPVTIVANDGVIYNLSLHDNAPKPEWIVNTESSSLASAWNLAISQHPEEHEFIICNSDVEFDGLWMVHYSWFKEFVSRRGIDYGWATVSSYVSWSAFLLKRSTWSKVGPFDENFTYGYEDDDYYMRMQLCDIPMLNFTQDENPLFPFVTHLQTRWDDGTQVLASIEEQALFNPVHAMEPSREYFRQKWTSNSSNPNARPAKSKNPREGEYLYLLDPLQDHCFAPQHVRVKP